MDGGEADLRHKITTVGTCDWLRMSLGVPDVYLIERAPRCLCYASPRPADGANGAMHTVGRTQTIRSKNRDIQAQGGMLEATS